MQLGLQLRNAVPQVAAGASSTVICSVADQDFLDPFRSTRGTLMFWACAVFDGSIPKSRLVWHEGSAMSSTKHQRAVGAGAVCVVHRLGLATSLTIRMAQAQEHVFVLAHGGAVDSAVTDPRGHPAARVAGSRRDGPL